MKANCWEFKGCGHGPDGDASCPAARARGCDMNGGDSGGRVCWVIPGTVCHGELQGSATAKLETCLECEFFQAVRQEEGERFQAGAGALIELGDHQSLELAYQQLIATFLDLKRASAELLHSQKLAAIGTLAAGVAHEINTPAQYVGDSLHFLSSAFSDIRSVLHTYRRVLDGLADSRPELLDEVALAEDQADLAYLEESTPKALDRAADGMSRISHIVGAMKEFAHPKQSEKSPADLNRAVETTLTIARNEYKYLADVETDLGDLPPVTCHVEDINQVLLNLVVNSAHAIAQRGAGDSQRGKIQIRTAREGERVRIEVEDTGCGIPDAIKGRIFEPFFTTKEVGRGTGQGLSIARSLIVEKHGGSLTFTSQEGVGTRFVVRLPIEAAAAAVSPG
jgi:signal transduction histidine kinase